MRGLRYVENDEGIAGKTFMSGPENAPLKERTLRRKRRRGRVMRRIGGRESERVGSAFSFLQVE